MPPGCWHLAWALTSGRHRHLCLFVPKPPIFLVPRLWTKASKRKKKGKEAATTRVNQTVWPAGMNNFTAMAPERILARFRDIFPVTKCLCMLCSKQHLKQCNFPWRTAPAPRQPWNWIFLETKTRTALSENLDFWWTNPHKRLWVSASHPPLCEGWKACWITWVSFTFARAQVKLSPVDGENMRKQKLEYAV